MADRNLTAPERNVRKDLEQLNAELQIAQSGIVVVIASLRAQNADLDPDIVNVLEHHVSSRLFTQAERLEGLIGSLPPHAAGLTDPESVEHSGVP